MKSFNFLLNLIKNRIKKTEPAKKINNPCIDPDVQIIDKLIEVTAIKNNLVLIFDLLFNG